MKKLISLLLALIMVLSLAACGGDSKTPDNGSKTPAGNDSSGGTADGGKLEHMDISVGYWDVETALCGDDIQKFIEEKFNVTFEPMNVTWDDYYEKEQTWAATDSLPDVFCADFRASATFGKWAREGVIRSIPEDLSAYPNLSAYLDSPAAEGCKIDGDLYCIFRKTYQEQAETVKDRIILYRWDLAQKAGVTKEPETWDEFRDMIRKIMSADPEGKSIGGMTAPAMNYLVFPFCCYSMPGAVLEGIVFNWVDNGSGTYVPAYFGGKNLGDDALPTFQLLRDMYTEGTIDPDMAMATLAESNAKFLGGRAAALCTTDNQVKQHINDWPGTYGHDMNEDVKYLSLMPSVDGNTYYWAIDYAWSETMFSANVDDAKMERLLMIYDYLVSGEGALKGRFGNEGESYQIVDGKLEFIDNKAAVEVYPSCELFGNLVSWCPELPNGYVQPYVYPDWYEDWKTELTDLGRACEDVMPTFDRAYTQAFMNLNSDFRIKMGEDMLNIMVGDRPVEEMWNEILDNYKTDGLEDVIKAVNESAK